jgi:orotate phosphoribosyltransferase
MAENNVDVVVGFICQNRLASSCDFLHFSPGVKIQNGDNMRDNLGQSYTSPQNLKSKGIDYMIIGRGITESNIPNVMIKLYQQDFDKKTDNLTVDVLKQSIINKGIVKHGDFVLSSGEHSNIYADFRLLTGHPQLMLQVANEFQKICEQKGLTPENSVLMGIPMGGIALSSSISFVSNIPMAIVREKRKEYGSKNLVEGMNVDDVKKRHVILIEDVITTGNSLAKTINMLNKEEDIVVDYVLCILDREKGGKKLLEDEYDVCVDSLYLLSELNK